MASLELSSIYQVGFTEKVRELEAELARELAELRTELEDVDLPAKTVSSVPIPEKKEHFKQERQLTITRILEVSVAQPVCIQAEQMKTEMDITQQNEYTSSSLPLLLLQHFTERIQHLVHLKHQYMLRWRRFCEHTKIIEAMYPAYSERLQHILDEYKDCVQRAQRLSVAREALMLDKPESAMTAISIEDLLIYLRWLVCHLHSMKKFNQFLKVLQWLPVIHKMDVAPPDNSSEEKEETTHAAKLASCYHDNIFTHKLPERSKSTSARSVDSAASTISPLLPVNPILLSTNPLPASAISYSAADTGGGLAPDDHLLSLPLHKMDLESLRPQLHFLINVYGITFNLSNVHNSSDEMEMFAAINHKFKKIFIKQEQLNQFKTYDMFEAGKETSETEQKTNIFKKEANWCDFVSLYPENDSQQEKMWAELQQRKYVDEILKVQAHLIKVNSWKKVQDTLKKHAALVHDPAPVRTASVTSHRTPNNTSLTWKKIYSNPDLYTDTEQDETVSIQDIDDRNVENVSFGARSGGGAGAHRRKDSYDYLNTVQMLGLDNEDKDKSDLVITQGAYLSYLHLRHLRIRDLQRTCLSVLNYFRSIERTLTINDQGLIADEDRLQRGSFQNHHFGTDKDGGTGGGGGLGYHGYLYNNPADFKMSESDYIQFSEVTNHDDFYIVEDGHVQVHDQKGHCIMYDKALEDLRSLEADLLLVSSHYIDKNRDLRSTAQHGMFGSRGSTLNQAGDLDIPHYAQQDIDRFGVLLDVWMNHSAFLECKRELLDCYYEAYQHVVDRDERRRLAQVITNIMHQWPRFDLHSDYFVRMYRAECSVLRKHTALVKAVLDRQIESEREYIQRVTRDGDKEFGLPHTIIAKQPVAINLSRPALKNVYMLEFHSSLAVASRLPAALRHAYWELHEVHQPSSLLSAVVMEEKLLQVALEEWDTLSVIGTSFSMQVQKDLFSDTFAEDPVFQCQLALYSIKQQDEVVGRRSHKEKQLSVVETVGRLMNIITLRHRLIEACWETEILSKVYKEQASDMGFSDFHLNLRFVQFEFASFKEEAGRPPPVFMTTVQEDDTAVDKYAPSCLYLAIHELDEGHVGRFSFRSRDGMLQLMRPGGMDSFQVVLKAQVLHKNALIAAVQQVNLCDPIKITEWKSGRVSPTETKSEKSSLTQVTSISSTNAGMIVAGKLTSDSHRSKKTAEAFFSLQLEKSPSRDLMLNDFVARKQQMGTVLKNPEELEKVKRMLVSEFCERFYLRVALTSMRGQLLAYYASIQTVLSRFPSVREAYFILGEPNEKKAEDGNEEDLSSDPRTMKKRPRRLLSNDGRRVLNIWFVPHHTEVVSMFRTLEDSLCAQALAYSVSIVAALHDILQYLCAHTNLGSSHLKVASHRMESTNVGVMEGMGSELLEIQKQIQHLPDPMKPESVLELLNLRRDVMFLEYDTAVRNCMPDTFLSSGNTMAHKSIISNAQYGLTSISNVQRPGLSSTYLTIPEPLQAKDIIAKYLFPWRAFINSNGVYPLAFSQWFRIESFMDLCLARLKDTDRHVASGEILGVHLLMEDVLRSGSYGDLPPRDSASRSHSQSVSRGEPVQSSQNVRGQNVTSNLKEASNTLAFVSHQSLSRIKQPLESYHLLVFFLMLWKCLERLKLDWGKRKLSLEKIDNPVMYREFCKVYRTEILLPALQSVARRLGQGDFYDSLVLDSDVYVMPQGASEIEVKLKQMLRLLEIFECHMIMEVRKRVSRELTLAVAERAREEEALPTDLWRRTVMKESLTLNRPHLAEKFVTQLMSAAKEDDTNVTFDSRHLQLCLSELARSVMARERQNFDSYSVYYENMLKVHHQLLFQREQEVKHLQEQLRRIQGDMKVSVQCQQANEAQDLLMEVTALRAKVMEMRELSLTQEMDTRERVKEEYEDLIHNIFNSTFLLRSKFDEFRNDLQDDVMSKVTETRREAVDTLSKLQQKFTGTFDKEELKAALDETDQIRTLQHENHLLNKAIVKLKALNTWRQNIRTQNFIQTTSDLRKKAENSKKDLVEVQMLAEEEVILLRQQLVALRNMLTSTEKDCSEVRKLLQREMKIKAERQHEEAEKKRGKHQLDQVKQASVDKLVDELVDKELKLKKLESDLDRSTRQSQIEYQKTKRNVEAFRKQSGQERNLKLEAFQRVDVLQSQVYDLETCLVNRSPSLLASSSKQRSRATSAQTSRCSRPSTGGSQWPPTIKWPVGRSITPFGEQPIDTSIFLNNEAKTLQRPKTVGDRVRGRITEPLLSKLEPGTQGRLVSS